jgi:predicted ATPase/DNA-binding SARP family transcriptional activator
MEIGVLGPLRVTDDDGVCVPLVSGRHRLLLGLLVAAGRRGLSVDELVESIWGEDLPDHPRSALHSQVSRLRHRLGPAGECIASTASGYRLEPPGEAVDAARFERLVETAREVGDSPGDTLELLDRALQQWHGPAYADLEDSRVIAPEATRLEELRATAAEWRADVLLDLDRPAEVVAAMVPLAGCHPFRERPVALLMRALAREGRAADALAEFRRFAALLGDELGLAPSPALRALQTRILRAEPATPVPVIGRPGNSFVGRAAEVERITGAFRRGRLVTLTGPGGVGKTRLACHVASRSSGSYPDGVELCELSGVSAPDGVAAAVAAVLRVEVRPGRSLSDGLVEALRTRRMLVVLDNCEQVRPAVARLVAEILRRAPGVQVLATSRERLGVEGEQRVSVEPLPVPAGDYLAAPAARLFVDRVTDVCPDLVLDADAGTAVAALCRHLDGLPLAIELAAAQAVWRSLPEIRDAVAGRLAVLADGRREVGRHRSLEAVFGWSYDLLAADERETFARLSVFAGGFTHAAAASVTDATDAQLAALVERSLVTARTSGGISRYRLLEPVRQYAAARLERSGRLGVLRARHAAWAAELAEAAGSGLCGPEEVNWRETLVLELDNLRVAHRWCVDAAPDLAVRSAGALYRYLWGGGPAEMYEWAGQALARLPDTTCDDAAAPGFAAAHASAALGTWHRGDLAGARRLAERGLAGRDPLAGRYAWEVIGDVDTFLGRFDDAAAGFTRAVDLARVAGDVHHQAVTLLDRALSLAYAGRGSEALADCASAGPLVAEAANPSLSAWSDYVNGEIRLEHLPAEALPFLRRGLATARRIGNRLIIGVAGLSAVSCEGRTGEPAAALSQYAELIEHWRRHGARNMQWATLRNLVVLLARMGRDDEAARLYGAMVASSSAPPPAGADATRLADALAAVRSRLGEPVLAARCAEGAALTDDEALVEALACCRGLPGVVPSGGLD